MTEQRVFAILIILLTAVGCDRQVPPPVNAAPAPAQTSDPNVQWVDPKTIQPGPIRQDSLTPQQMDRVKRLQTVFVEVDGQSVDQWVDNFKRDLNPDRELAIWERMAKAYTEYCSNHTLTLEGRKEVFKVVLLRSMAPEKDVLERLELKVLTEAEAVEVMRAF